MADPELEAIRQRRMQELMAQNGVQGNSQNSDKQKAQEEAKRNLTTQCREDELVEEVNGDDDVALGVGGGALSHHSVCVPP
ncbi:hypothetical protein RHGRI_004990 [Rhododendron griersonianum]|uniref:Programmed cell death 5 n=1 Tax=Rhododendron griersonianum TaxID=479676 RepID=A0AAV6LBN5_9ERIC|nr:hypothetical protein RHGRI_004990 [Rhododendron griersonianum]